MMQKGGLQERGDLRSGVGMVGTHRVRKPQAVVLEYAPPPRHRPVSFLALASLLAMTCFLLLLAWDCSMGRGVSVWPLGRPLSPALGSSGYGLKLFIHYYLGELALVGGEACRAALLGTGLACLCQAARPCMAWVPALIMAHHTPDLAIAKCLVLNRHWQRGRLAACLERH